MRARIGVALALALAAGCSGTNNAAVDADAAADADGSAVARGETAARPDADARAETATPDLGTDRDATEAGADLDARPDADALEEARPDADADAVSPGVDATDAAETDAPKACTITAPTLTLPMDSVTGTLSGQSRNSVVSCQILTQTLGPEAVFRLKIDTTSLIEVKVDSTVDTFLAVRPGCGEDGTELSCSSTPLDQPPATGAAGFDGGLAGSAGGPFFDAGSAGSGAAGVGGSGGSGATDAAADGGDGGLGHRVGLLLRLTPGTYTIFVDTTLNETASSAGATPFTLSARTVSAAENASCDTPEILDASSVRRGKLDLAGAPKMTCSGATGSPLYYAVGVPPGQRLTARVQPLAVGDRAWLPRIEALSACTQGASCLAQGHAAAGSVQQLDWINNNSTWRLVTLAVSSDVAVNGAQFDLVTGVTDLLATCARPTPVKDGMAVFNQDIIAAPSPGMQTCGPFSDHAYYYSATLLPDQSLSVTVVGSTTQNPFASPAFVSLRSSCQVDTCFPNNGNGTTTLQNTTDQAETVIIEVAASGNNFIDPRFDMHVSMPLPPAGVLVTPLTGLSTSEAGQTATFTVALKSPPTKSVTIPIASDTPAEGTASPAMLVFDPSNWSQAQTVTVTGVNDQLSDGPHKYKVLTGAASSADIRYASLDAPDVEITNLDDDPGLLIVGADAVITSESGLPATFTVRLNGKPTDTVRVPLSSSDVGEGTVSPAELTFGPNDWNTPQTVTVTGVDDVATDGVQAFSIVIGALVSNDAGYAGLNPDDVPAHNRDDDFQPVSLKLLSTDTCGFPNHGGMAIDGFGTLYIALFCSQTLSMVTSADGGATFTAPVIIPDSTDLGGDFVVAAGDGGTVYVAFEVPNQGVMFTASTDGGLTWSQRKLVTASGGNMRMSAAHQTVAVSVTHPNGSSSIFVRSTDGGRSFLPARFFEPFAIDVAVEPDGQTIWIPELQPGGKLRGSSDAGATISEFGSIDITFGPSIVGTQHIWTNAGTFAQVVSLADTTNIQTIANTGMSGQPFAITLDSAETATLFNMTPDGSHTEAVRATVAGNVSVPKNVGPRADVVWAVPLSRKVVATIIYTGGLPLFSTTAF